MMFKKTALATFCFLLSGCATVFTGTDQAINIKVTDKETQKNLSQVNCNIIDSTGAVYKVNSNPGSVTVTKGNAPLRLECSKKGYEPSTSAMNDSFNATSLLNVFFWPGFFVDIATGSIKKYPGQYSVAMAPETS